MAPKKIGLVILYNCTQKPVSMIVAGGVHTVPGPQEAEPGYAQMSSQVATAALKHNEYHDKVSLSYETACAATGLGDPQAHPADAKLMLLNTNHGFFCHRDFVADSFFEASQINALFLGADGKKGIDRLPMDSSSGLLMVSISSVW